MPLYEYLCVDCGDLSEILVMNQDVQVACEKCGSVNLKRMLSAPSSYSGSSTHSLPGAGDTACCGSTPASTGCAGPGSCCGKTAH